MLLTLQQYNKQALSFLLAEQKIKAGYDKTNKMSLFRTL